MLMPFCFGCGCGVGQVFDLLLVFDCFYGLTVSCVVLLVGLLV